MDMKIEKKYQKNELEKGKGKDEDEDDKKENEEKKTENWKESTLTTMKREKGRVARMRSI